MLVHPQFDPIAIQLGPLAVRWYGLMYLVAFGLLWAAGRWRIAHRPDSVWSAKDLDDALFYGILGTIIGGRLGYVLFYKLGDYLPEPWRIFYVWEGGMSFHGGFLGVLLVCFIYGQVKGWKFFDVMDFVAPAVPIGLALGRLGNFINGELTAGNLEIRDARAAVVARARGRELVVAARAARRRTDARRHRRGVGHRPGAEKLHQARSLGRP